MKVRLVLLGLGAMLALPGLAVAQAGTLSDGTRVSSITCAPLAGPPAPDSNDAPSPAMAEMCTAADPWHSKATGAHNDQGKRGGPVDDKRLIDRR